MSFLGKEKLFHIPLMSNVWTLLITDDCREDREIYQEYLSNDSSQSYRFIEAGSAEVGLALCQKQHCDAILLDFRLPDMTGLEFLDELKQQSDAPLPVIMLTGQGDERVAVQAMKRGAQDYLVKQDLEPDVLQHTVRNVLQQAYLKDQSSQKPERRLTAEIALRLHRSLDSSRILQATITEAQRVLECDRVVIYQATSNPINVPEGKALTLTRRCETNSSSAADPVHKFVSFLIENHPANSPVTHEPSILVSGSQKKETYLFAPILLQSSTSQAWGLLVACQHSNQRVWHPDEVRFLNDLAGQCAIVLQQSEQLTQALEALESEKQLNLIRLQMVATVSHEYRSPLAAILAAASTLKLHRQLPGMKQQQFLQVIEDKARQMTQLVDSLLVLEVFEAGKAKFSPLPCELLQFVSDLIDEQRKIIGTQRELTFKITGNTKGFRGDQQLLRVILVNLLSNAIKYSIDGSEIEVHLIGNDNDVLIKVKDEGIGIPVAEQSQVFQSFERGSNVGTIAGTGLGLAIVKACVELHGGKVTLVSQEGKGTQFTVCLPKRASLL